MPKAKAPPPTLKPGHALFEVIDGAAGPSLYVGDFDGGHRLAGPKPWGGGSTAHRFQVNITELRRELDAFEAAQAASGGDDDA